MTSVFIEVSEKEENLSHDGKKASHGGRLRQRGIFHVNKSEERARAQRPVHQTALSTVKTLLLTLNMFVDRHRGLRVLSRRLLVIVCGHTAFKPKKDKHGEQTCAAEMK